jgi:CBS domain containing-hemolysin-like protein
LNSLPLVLLDVIGVVLACLAAVILFVTAGTALVVVPLCAVVRLAALIGKRTSGGTGQASGRRQSFAALRRRCRPRWVSEPGRKSGSGKSGAPTADSADPGCAGLGQTELAMMDNIRGFAATSAREIMIPRTEVACLYADLPIAENRTIAVFGRHTRYPVCERDKDHIIGYVHIKDLLCAGNDERDIRAIVRPILRFPESVPISRLLGHLQQNGAQIALLVDEYGGTAGIVTAEDIVEEIVGEMRDEFDAFRPAIVEREDMTFSVDGMLHIDEFNAYFGTQIDPGELDTIGGWMYARLDLPPRKGQSVPLGDFRLVVEEVDHLRISRLIVCRAGEEDGWQDVS